MFYPASEIFNPMTFAAPPPDPKDLLILPRIRLIRTAAAPSDGSSPGSIGYERQRLHLEMRLAGPSWGFVNVTGPLLAWSFTDPPPVARDPRVCTWAPGFGVQGENGIDGVWAVVGHNRC